MDALPSGDLVPIYFNGTNNGRASILCDLIQPSTAHILGKYEDSIFYRDMACITVNRFGSGKEYYGGTYLDDLTLNDLITDILTKADITPIYSNGVECVTRSNENEGY